MDRVLITGGSGVLGKRLIEIFSDTHEVYAPNSTVLDITSIESCNSVIQQFKPKILIHAAAFVDTFECENDTTKAIDVNIIGTVNIVKAVKKLEDCKLVYISTEYVFGGNKGNYTIDDKLDPINIYGKTKAASEYIASIVNKHQILRCPFIKKTHPNVFVDQYCSRYFLEDLVLKIKNNILNNQNELVHISSQRDSLFNIYKAKGYSPNPIRMNQDSLKVIPKDSSIVNNSI